MLQDVKDAKQINLINNLKGIIYIPMKYLQVLGKSSVLT